MNNSAKLLEIIDDSYYPILGNICNKNDFLGLDFTSNNKELANVNLLNTAEFSSYVFEKISKSGKLFGIGGYAENRAIYNRSLHFTADGEPRTIHLGVDIWAKAGTQIFCPLNGKIHSFRNNNQFGDYGPTLILEHVVSDQKFYSLYGHLSIESIGNQYVGREFKMGEKLCTIGDFPINGDWPPHLHFQLIIDIGTNWGDYPGVCKISERAHYLNNCPDPNFLIFTKTKKEPS
jgi:peptidoglycan LD-endopeptidase LytH